MKTKTKNVNGMFESTHHNRFFNYKISFLTFIGLGLLSCQSPNERASANKPDSLAMEQGLRQDSMKQDTNNQNIPNKGANTISSKAQIDDDQSNFLKEVATGSLMEIQAGKLAAEKASDPSVKDFAQRMVTDHTKASKELMPMAQELGVLLPSALEGPHLDHVNMLKGKSGANFDKVYMEMMVKDHAKTVQLFKLYTSARNPSVAQFANKYLPVIEAHYKQAQQISKND